MKSRWLYRLMHRLALRTARKIIAPSIATQNDLIRLFSMNPDQVQVIPEGVDDRFKPASIDQVAAIKAKYQLPAHYLLYVGINKPPKNIVRLIEAYARVVQQNSDFEYDCVVAGAWDDRYPQAKQRASELGVAERVRFIGSITDVDLPVLYSSADVFVTASLYEGFGLPILEAMACGTPVISSRASSLPEVVGDAGLLFDPASVEAIALAIQHITSDAQLRMNLKQRGLDRAKQFTWPRAAERTLAVYRSVKPNYA
jgi:glycosyltransferase involved in cell wall biosynthesis